MPVAIVPAAGRSRRMGRPKLLLPFGGSTVVGSLVAALRRGGVERIVLVVSPGGRRLARWGEGAGLEVALNPDPGRGMLSSVQAGLEALGGAEGLADRRQVLLVSPADLPALDPGTVERLVRQRQETGALLALPVHRGRRGHPLAVAPSLVPEIARLDLAVGLRQLLDRHPGEVLEVAVEDPGAVHDVDTPEDYRRLRQRS